MIKFLLAMTLGLLTISCTACISFAPGGADSPSRSPGKQMGSAVKITTTCLEGIGTGTGVLVSKDQILTAEHVVTCDVGPAISITVDPGDATQRTAEIEILLPGADVARISLTDSSLEDYFTPVSIGERPTFGDKVCMTSAVPRWGYHCGTVQPGTGRGMFTWDWFTEFGNSGSGVYHNGKLVGLMDALSFCQGHYQCVGYITPLQDFPWLIP